MCLKPSHKLLFAENIFQRIQFWHIWRQEKSTLFNGDLFTMIGLQLHMIRRLRFFVYNVFRSYSPKKSLLEAHTKRAAQFSFTLLTRHTHTLTKPTTKHPVQNPIIRPYVLTAFCPFLTQVFDVPNKPN